MNMLRQFFAPLAMLLAFASSSAPAARHRTAAPSHHVDPAPPVPPPCLQFYLGGQAPAVVAPTAPNGQVFCHSFYALSYSTALHDPIWTSYELTAAMVRGSAGFDRANITSFAAQAGLSATQQARNSDYTDRRFQRGHMTPDNDAGDEPAQADTYVITNVVPQNGGLNGGLWARLEGAVHALGGSEGSVFVVTGPLFESSRPPMHGIAIPSHTFKAIFVPSRGFALAFVATNEKPTVCTIVPIDDIARRAGIDPFPSLPASVKATLPVRPPGWGHFPRACH
jgi:endonuclease G